MVRAKFEQDKFIGFRTQLEFKREVEEYVKKNGYPSVSDFMREIVEKEFKK